MPEGDTIFRSATTLRPAMEGRVIEDARIRDRQFECERIVGRTVTNVEARGKHLLMHLDNDAAIHSHMGMTGSWHVYHPGQPWRKPTHYAALQLAIYSLEVICFSPRLLELLTEDQLRRHPHLSRLGPDLLSTALDIDSAVARFRARNHLPLGEAVMNQTIVSGIGNIYKSECLFIMQLDPFAPVERYSDDELARLIAKARYLLRRNSGGPNRTTRVGSDAGRMWVYGKSGRPCPKCGSVIEIRRQGEQGRTTYWCRECQPAR
ncbi:MAG TPA: DNA-formamidopyrimidine glycosylase family protein [Lacipirellula sp.]